MIRDQTAAKQQLRLETNRPHPAPRRPPGHPVRRKGGRVFILGVFSALVDKFSWAP